MIDILFFVLYSPLGDEAHHMGEPIQSPGALATHNSAILKGVSSLLYIFVMTNHKGGNTLTYSLQRSYPNSHNAGLVIEEAAASMDDRDDVFGIIHHASFNQRSFLSYFSLERGRRFVIVRS